MIKTDCQFNTKSKMANSTECSNNTCTRVSINNSEPFPVTLRYGEWFRIEPTLTTFETNAVVTNGSGYSYFYVNETTVASFNGIDLNIQQDCTFSSYDWGNCSKMCGAGKELGTRGNKLKEARHGGKPCSDTPKIKTRDCDGILCPINCTVIADTFFGKCDAQCGVQGLQYKNHTITTPPQYDGKPCPDLERRGCKGGNDEGFCDCYGRKEDQCGVCGGDDSSCTGCDGIIDTDEQTRKIWNECGKCETKDTPCVLKKSTMHLKRKEFKSNLLKTLLPVGTMVILSVTLTTIFVYTIRSTKRKKREIYLS